MVNFEPKFSNLTATTLIQVTIIFRLYYFKASKGSPYSVYWAHPRQSVMILKPSKPVTSRHFSWQLLTMASCVTQKKTQNPSQGQQDCVIWLLYSLTSFPPHLLCSNHILFLEVAWKYRMQYFLRTLALVSLLVMSSSRYPCDYLLHSLLSQLKAHLVRVALADHSV